MHMNEGYGSNSANYENLSAQAKQKAAYQQAEQTHYACNAEPAIDERNSAADVLRERAQVLLQQASVLRAQATQYRALADLNVERAGMLARDSKALSAAAELHDAK